MEPYQELEKKYADFVGSKYAVTCSSGTAALHLSLLALGVGRGDEVIVPDFTMAACGFAVNYTGAAPVFVDVTDSSYGIDPRKLEKAITKRTKVIMAVHIYGRLADMKAVLRIAGKHGIPVVEDACEAQGAVFKSKADITVYSLYRNKIVHAEEGGVITTNNKSHVARINYLKNMAFGPDHDYFHKEIGYNYRLPNTEAALALKSLKEYPRNNQKRRMIERWYSQYLSRKMPLRDAVWFYEVFAPPRAKRAILKEIPRARDCFKPLSSFPIYGSKRNRSVASRLADSLILLPASPDLTKPDVKRMCDIVNKHLQTHLEGKIWKIY